MHFRDRGHVITVVWSKAKLKPDIRSKGGWRGVCGNLWGRQLIKKEK